jgi:hypothetical protein
MKSIGWLVALAAVLVAGCDQSPTAPTSVRPTTSTAPAPTATPTARSTDIVHVPFFIQDAAGQLPAAASTPLFEARKRNPVLTPAGRQITFGEFEAVEGSAVVQCMPGGTQVTLQLRNLIPNGVYSIWNLVFNPPGFDPSFANLSGIGAAGSSAGSENTFRASASGDGTLTALTAGGPLSMQGSIGACALTDEFEWHVVGAYHIDGQSHGPSPGPDGTSVEQFGFIFKR